jgi:hypothetical protein
MNEQRLAEIEARANAATPPPWLAVPRDSTLPPEHEGLSGLGWDIEGPPEPQLRGQFARGADARFIAESRVDVPALIAEVRRLRAAIRDVLQLEAVSDDATGLLADQIFAVACDRLHRALTGENP